MPFLQGLRPCPNNNTSAHISLLPMFFDSVIFKLFSMFPNASGEVVNVLMGNDFKRLLLSILLASFSCLYSRITEYNGVAL